MSIHVNILLDEGVYARLKAQVPAKALSRFINDALKTCLRPSLAALEAGYRADAEDEALQTELADWAGLETEGWPE